MADQTAPTRPIVLAPAGTDVGAMERLFLLEAVTPAYPRKFDADRNLEAMRLMRQTIENRLKSPQEYTAPGARTATDIIELGNQFAGFGGYPNLSGGMTTNLADILRIANDPRHPHQGKYARFVNDAITAATESVFPVRATHPNVTAWRTQGSGSPGKRFHMLVTLSGNTFFSTNPAVPLPPMRTPHRSPRRH